MSYRVAVVGATGNVGREMLNILHERNFPISELIPLASTRSIGKEVSFGDTTLKCQALDQFDFSGVDIALFSAGGAISKEWGPKVAAAGAVVIDNEPLVGCTGGGLSADDTAAGPILLQGDHTSVKYRDIVIEPRL